MFEISIFSNVEVYSQVKTEHVFCTTKKIINTILNPNNSLKIVSHTEMLMQFFSFSCTCLQESVNYNFEMVYAMFSILIWGVNYPYTKQFFFLKSRNTHRISKFVIAISCDIKVKRGNNSSSNPCMISEIVYNLQKIIYSDHCLGLVNLK